MFRTSKTKHTLLKRVVAFAAAAAIATTTTISAFAININYTWDSNINPTLATKKSGVSGGVKDQYVEAGEQICRFKIDSKTPYGICVAPATTFGGATNIDGYASNSWSGGNNYWKNQVSSEMKKTIGLIMYYGYPNASTSDDYFCATQILVWETVLGYRKSQAYNGETNLVNTETWSATKDALWNDLTYNKAHCYTTKDKTKAAYNAIVSKVKNHNTIPGSFYATTSEASKNAKVMKYNFSTKQYEYTLKVSKKWLDSSKRVNYHKMIDTLKSKGFTVTVTNNSDPDYKSVKVTTSKGVDTGVITINGTALAPTYPGKILTHASTQTIASGSPTPDTKKAYVRFITPNMPNLKVIKTYEDEDGNAISGSNLDKLLSETTFTMHQGTAGYVKATWNSAEDYYVFSGFTSDVASATKFKAHVISGSKAGFDVIDLPTQQDKNVNYKVQEYSVPAGYTKLNSTISMTGWKSSAPTTNAGDDKVTLVNNQAVYGSATLEKRLTNAKGNNIDFEDTSIKSEYSDTMKSIRFIAAYRDGTTWKYLKDVYTNKALTSSADTDAGQYWLKTNISTDGSTSFISSNVTTDFNQAYQFTPGYLSTANYFGKVRINGLPVDSNGNTVSLLFIEVDGVHGYGYNDNLSEADAVEMSNLVTYTNTDFNNFSGLIKGVAFGASDASSIKPAVVVGGDGRSNSGDLVNQAYHFKAKVRKFDADTDKPLAGAIIGLYATNDESAEPLAVVTTSSDGYGYFSLPLVCDRQYYIHEIQAPAGYALSTKWATVSINPGTSIPEYTFVSSLVGETSTDVMNESYKLDLSIVKTDSVYNTPINGAEFNIVTNQDLSAKETAKIADSNYANKAYSAGDVVGKVITDKDGKANYYGLPLGGATGSDFNYTYKVVEVSVPSPYVLDTKEYEISAKLTDISADLTATKQIPLAGVSAGIINDIQTVNVKIHKVDNEKNNISGVVFSIYANEDIVLGGQTVFAKDSLIATLPATDADGNTSSVFTKYRDDSEDMPYTYTSPIYPGFSYRISEDISTVPADLKPLDKDIIFTATAGDITVASVDYNTEIENQQLLGNVEVQKKTKSMRDVSGIEMSLSGKTASGKKVDLKQTTDASGLAKFVNVPVGTYTLSENSDTIPFGYVKAADIDVTVIANETVHQDMFNSTTVVEFGKVSSLDESLKVEGAKLRVVDASGKVMDTWTTGSTIHVLDGKLKAGETYWLEETSAPAGYLKADRIKFTVPTKANVLTMYMKDDPTVVEFSKTSLVDGTELPGAKLELRNTNGDLVATWKTSDKPTTITGKLAAGETYILSETYAPAGYVVADSVRFKVNEDNTITKVSMIDAPTKVSISKTDITGDKEIPGARLQIKNSEGKVVEEWTSKIESHEIVAKLVAGEKYTLHEDLAPAGYAYASDIEFTVSKTGDVTKVVMTDAPTKVKVTKTDITGTNEIPGALLQVRDADGNVYDEWTSDGTPHVISNKLVAGAEYYLHEEIAPDGYVVAHDVKFVVNKDATVTSVSMKDDTTKVSISKKSITGDDELPGAKLKITDENGRTVEEWTSTIKPHYIEGKLLAGGKYTLHEEVAPNGYVIANDVKFTVDETGKVTLVKMVDDTTKIHISKLEADAIKFIPGAKLQILDKNNKVVEEWVTDNDVHKIEGKLIANAEYTLHEVSAPAGYVLSKDIKFTVATTGEVQNISMVDKPTVVRITKQAITGDAELPGAKLKVLDTDGNTIDSWTSTTVAHEIRGTLVAGKKYILHEEVAPAGYVAATDVEFTVSADGSVDLVVMKDDTTKVEIGKYSNKTGELLAGAELCIYDTTTADEDGVMTAIDTWVSTNELHRIDATLVAGRKYILHEISAPAGYVIAEDVEFTVSETGEIDKITMNDDTTKVYIAKISDVTNKPLAGATLQVLAADGSVVAEWVTTNDVKYFDGELLAGKTYTLHEVAAPNGYVVADDVTFIVSTTGEVDDIVMVDAASKVHFSKTDITTGKEIKGAQLSIIDSNGEEVHSWITTGEKYVLEGVLEPGQTYTLHEIAAPRGYLVANDVKFTVDKNGRIDKVEMVDDTTKVSITKTDITGTKEIPGAKLQVIDSDGNVVDEWISTIEAHFIEGKLTAGATYTLHEEVAPNGYVVGNDVKFTVSLDGSVDEVSMANDVTKVRISKQDITTGKELPGAKLQILDKDDNVVHEWTTTDTPEYIEGKLIAGTEYTLREITAPNGYKVAEDVKFTVKADGTITEVVMKDAPSDSSTSDSSSSRVDTSDKTNKNPGTGNPAPYVGMTLGVLGLCAVFAVKKKNDK